MFFFSYLLVFLRQLQFHLVGLWRRGIVVPDRGTRHGADAHQVLLLGPGSSPASAAATVQLGLLLNQVGALDLDPFPEICVRLREDWSLQRKRDEDC